MYREPVGDALYAAEAVVDKASDSCESIAAIHSFAPPIFLSLLPPRRFWRHPRKKETYVNCSADSSCRKNTFLPRWGNVLPVFTRCSSPLSRMLQTRLSISWEDATTSVLGAWILSPVSTSMPALCNRCGAFYNGLGDGGRFDQQRICRRS